MSSSVCHCLSCRKAAAAPSVAWVTFARERVQWLAGEPRSFASSPGVTRRFCEACGGAVSYESENFPAHVDLTTLSLDDANAFPPTHELWLEEKLPWQVANGALHGHVRDANSAPADATQR